MSDTPKNLSLLMCINKRYDLGKPCCANQNGIEIAEALEKGIEERGLSIKTERVNCLGHCTRGPTARLAPGGKFFFHMNMERVPEILSALEEKSTIEAD
ncbi:MAG: (2Fe-2S) ferredoxin domain-containing protein [Rhodospirillales bacterium]|nr:(2Fe-2S) ferredoxin domain-containing protein [Rhodospirillales bacterium]